MAVTHPLFARFYSKISVASDSMQLRYRKTLTDNLTGVVCEVGCGNGLNFAHYPDTVSRVVALEPEPYLRAEAERRARSTTVEIDVVDGEAEGIPLDDNSCDCVIFSLVLCSVDDVPAALSESRRVLKSGGELRFYEHVRAESNRFARYQELCDVAWPHLFGGCETARDTTSAIEASGFTNVTFERHRLDSRIPIPVSPHVIGTAFAP